ncbi:MAG TPA: ABC transporter permease [Planctomycetaceae bacterium]|nr:ABC transporter permease [Planctomycetaceae bacterium]
MTSATAPDQSQAAVVWRQFRKRKLAVFCAGVIVFLVTISIWAPFLAHDRPLYYRGVNRFEFREAVRTLREVAGRLPVTPPGATASLTDEKQSKTLWTAIRLQQRQIHAVLPTAKRPWFDQWINDARAAQTDAAGAAKLKELQRTLRKELGGNDIVIESQARFPVLASLVWSDVFFLVWSIVLLSFPLWTRLVHRTIPEERHRRRWWTEFTVWWIVPATAAVIWWSIVPVRIDRTNYKQGVLAEEESSATALVVYETVMWPPVAYAIDEDNLAWKNAAPALFHTETDRPALGKWDGPHWLGTDELGRDVLCRMLWGGRVSLSVGIVAVVIYVAIGIIVGALAGYYRGVIDLFVSRVIEVVICFPAFFLILTIVAFIGPSLLNIMVVIGLTGWTGIARLVRGEFLRLVDQEFVLAGKALGYSPARLIFRHVLPNALAPVLVSATFGVAGAILTESALSFLGLGISVPTPSWGGILSSGREAIFRAPWMIWFPGLAIFVTITCYNLVGEALRDASDPRLRGSR